MWLLLTAVAAARPAPATIDIRSETLTVEHPKRRAVFGGGATATRGDLVLECPVAIARYDASSRVRSVVCDGPVKATQGERVITAGHGEFDNAAGVLQLTGEPVLLWGERRITGESMTYDVATQAAHVKAARGQLPAGAGAQPMDVSAPAARFDGKAHSGRFEGGVVATSGDLVLHASELSTTFDERGQITRAVSSGGPVHVTEGARQAEAQRATYMAPPGRLVLEGQPVVTEGESRLTGERVVFLLTEDRVEVDRPRATFPMREEEGGRR